MNAKNLAMIGGVVLFALIVYFAIVSPQIDKWKDSQAGANAVV